MTLDKAIRLLEAEYERAKELAFVRNPIAYALYQVWKIADAKGSKRCEYEDHGRCFGQPETPPCDPKYCPRTKYKKEKRP